MTNDMQKTLIGATLTKEGVIPHLKLTCGDIHLMAPVKVKKREGGGEHLPHALYKDGALVYALPGGAEFLL